MELDNFILEEYNEYSKIHSEVMNILCSDVATKKYLGNLKYAVSRINLRKIDDNCNAFYIAFYNDEPIGYISLTNIDGYFQVSSSILPEFRGQHFAALLLEEFSEKVFEVYNYINKIDLVIDAKNIGSIKSAELADYKLEDNKYSRRRV